MTQLKDPMILASEPLGAAKIVAHDGTDTFFDLWRNRFDEWRPAFEAFGPFEKQRVQENGMMILDRFDGTQMKNPGLILESKPDSIEQKDKLTARKFLSVFLSDESSKGFSETITQTLSAEMMALTYTDKSSLLTEDSFEQNRTNPANRSTTFLDSNSPGLAASCALSASLTKKINFATTTLGHSGHVFHANRVATFRGIAKKLLTVDIS